MQRTLFIVWAVLVGLTVISAVTALEASSGSTSSGWIAATVALGAAYLKAAAVLRYFLGLGRAGAGWNGVFSGILLVILGGVLAAWAFTA